MKSPLLPLVVLLFITINTANVQAQSEFEECFSSAGCTGSISAVSAEDCCVNNPSGLYFNNGTQCLQCIVYGWGASSFTESEDQQPHDVPLAYFKGPSDVSLIVDIIDTGLGTAMSDDYTENDNNQLFLPLNPAGTTSVTFRPDNFALEPDETIVFDLNRIAVNPSSRTAEFDSALPNVFFQSRKTLTIQDSTELVFRLREADRSETEANGFIEVVVEVANQRDLAAPITLVLTPREASLDFRPLPDIRPIALANAHPDRIDFNITPIRLDFPVGRTREVSAFVPIIDDEINEALEFFAADLTFADPASVPDTVDIGGTSVIRLDIVDNDDIFIGFLLPNTTYPEREFTHFITLIKGAGNVTEQTLAAVVNLIGAVPPGTSFDVATPSEGVIDNDLTLEGGNGSTSILTFFPSESDEITVSITIFSDLIPENTEAVQLTLEIPTEDIFGVQAPRFEMLPEFPTFFVIIPDDDQFRVGFETLSYTVNEGVGFQQVCVNMTLPPADTPITGNFLVAVETVADTADESDYTNTSGFSAFVTFNNAQRRSCVDIFITDDNVYENEEQFSLRLSDLGEGFALPNNFILDPDMSEIIIQDNEVVTVGFIDPPYSAREDEGVMIFTVGVTSGHILDRDIELSFSTDDIDEGDQFATVGLDYTAISGMMLIFNGSMMRVQISVSLVNDTIPEEDETFIGELTLISGERVVIDEGIANATIIDDEIICLPLEQFPNGRIEYSPDTTSPYDLGTVATYICNEGFRLDISNGGSETRTCIDDLDDDTEGIFDNQAPRCVPVECLPLPDILNGVITYSLDMSANYSLGTVATYMCNEGFFLDTSAAGASATRTCIDDGDNDAEGIFDGEAPTCVPIECLPLPNIPNGVITYGPDNTANYTLDTNATYSCNDGFFLDTTVGDEVRTCIDDEDDDAEGEFDGLPPTCVPVQCLPLPPIDNGVITYAVDMIANFDLGTIATYSCNDGFVLDFSTPSSTETRECVEDNDNDAEGVFNREAPRCVPIECPPLPAFANGDITYVTDISPNFELGTTATYSCNDGFFLVEPNRVRTCIDDGDNDAEGVFNGQEPRCVPIECPPLPTIDNGDIAYATDTTPNYDLGTMATYSCNDGFFLVEPNRVRTCIDDGDNDAEGVFNGQEPRCVPVICDPLPDIVNGMITYNPDVDPNFPLDTNATYSCNEGYFLVVTESTNVVRTCEDDFDNDDRGVFSGEAPSCVPIECPPLPAFANGDITYATDTTPNYELGTTATYSCNEGFFLVEPDRVRTCIDDGDNDAEGVFNGQEPRCVPIECPPLPAFANGDITYATDTTPNYELGTTATYSCNDGFFLVEPNRVRTCIDDRDNDAEGVFDGQEPRCIRIECLPLSEISNGFINYSPDNDPNYDLGTIATYSCNEGHRLDISNGGSETRECVDDLDGDAEGVFSRQAPQCVRTAATVNDTVSGDPLYTVPLNIPDKSNIMNVGDDDPINLCFELHGAAGALLNLVSDTCVSVNARYAQVRPDENINIVNRIYVRAVGTDGVCRNIEVSLDQCSASVDDADVSDYSSAGISVREFRNRVRIVVPNCANIDLVMWVQCVNTTFWSRESTDENEVIFHAHNIRFVIARGLDLAERSHGLLGQFWNVPIQVESYTGPVRNNVSSDGLYIITTDHPDEPARSFAGWLWPLTWEFRMEYCLYAGQNQAGPLYEILDDSVNSAVIFGEYGDYRVASPYATAFSYAHFEEERCIGVDPPQ